MAKTFEEYLRSIEIEYRPVLSIEEYAEVFKISDPVHLERRYAKYELQKKQQWHKIVREHEGAYKRYLWRIPKLKSKQLV